MYFIRSTTLIIVLLVTISTIQGESAIPALDNLKDYVKYLLNLMRVENEYVHFLSYMKVYSPEDSNMKTLYNQLFSYDSYLSDLSQIYLKYYTLDDIIKLIHFYSSPLGKKTLQMNQELNRQMEDTMLNKISDYIFTSTEQGFDIFLPQIRK